MLLIPSLNVIRNTAHYGCKLNWEQRLLCIITVHKCDTVNFIWNDFKQHLMIAFCYEMIHLERHLENWRWSNQWKQPKIITLPHTFTCGVSGKAHTSGQSDKHTLVQQHICHHGNHTTPAQQHKRPSPVNVLRISRVLNQWEAAAATAVKVSQCISSCAVISHHSSAQWRDASCASFHGQRKHRARKDPVFGPLQRFLAPAVWLPSCCFQVHTLINQRRNLNEDCVFLLFQSIA